MYCFKCQYMKHHDSNTSCMYTIFNQPSCDTSRYIQCCKIVVHSIKGMLGACPRHNAQCSEKVCLKIAAQRFTQHARYLFPMHHANIKVTVRFCIGPQDTNFYTSLPPADMSIQTPILRKLTLRVKFRDCLRRYIYSYN